MYSTPKEAFFFQDRRDVLFFHTLFALKDENLGAFEANFVTLVLNMFVYLENKWEIICDIIETGILRLFVCVGINWERCCG